jgi:hypothetical protein
MFDSAFCVNKTEMQVVDLPNDDEITALARRCRLGRSIEMVWNG